MDASVKDAINEQINHEFYAAYLYLSMAAHFETEGFEGFGQWMRMQSREEVEHAMRLFDYLLRRGEEVELDAVARPEASFDSPVSIFRQALEHEKKVTGLINDLYELAVEKSDYPTQLELQWFIDEQVEEEESVGRVVEQLDMAGDSRAALLMLDQKLGARSSAE